LLKRILFPVFLFGCIFIILFPLKSKAQESASPSIDIVFCMDLSSSANGLIDHFRNHLWDYWYLMSHQCSPRVNYRIAFVAYSRFSYGKQNGYVRVVQNLTGPENFEPFSNTLFRIPSRIEKGTQFVGSALNACLKKINWSKDPNTIKIIFLVGNGDVTLGSEDIDKAVERLVAQNIIISPVYCTVPGEKKAIRGWSKIAQKANGKLETMSIKNRYFDRLNGFDLPKFRALNRRFNNTYLYYGVGAAKRFRMLNDEDNHVYITNTEGYRYRSMYKISQDYQRHNSSWDLVDLYYKNPVEFLNVDPHTMNDSCKRLNTAQLKTYIIFKKYERKKLGAMIADMLVEKEIKDREDGILQDKRIATLDIISIRILKDLLKQKGISCK